MKKIQIEVGAWDCSSKDTDVVIFNGKKLAGERFYYGGTESNADNFSEYALHITDTDLIVAEWSHVSLWGISMVVQIMLCCLSCQLMSMNWYTVDIEVDHHVNFNNVQPKVASLLSSCRD